MHQQPAHQTATPWGMQRMAPLSNGEATPWQYGGLDPQTQTGRWIGSDGQMLPVEFGKHGTSVNTYPPTQVSKDGKVDPDTGHDAEQDETDDGQ
ncbi:putative ATP-grasp-modified RiPP [Streptomyces sp. NBC_01465]|uniref:putative ATP-grasp-modified RiPP n=1 Tax=Streptomyces sp. NBC_01465 TaxID=2903878 RepID=UPI002E3236A1|nr:putative ATP-grasp-modified RiPP [Streptomyces sp. NBC_01465]